MKTVLATIVVPVAGMLVIAAVSLGAFQHGVRSQREVVERHAVQLIHIERLRSAFEWKGASNRGFFLTPDELFLEGEREARGQFKEALDYPKQHFSRPDRSVLDGIDRAEQNHQSIVQARRLQAAYEKEARLRRKAEEALAGRAEFLEAGRRRSCNSRRRHRAPARRKNRREKGANLSDDTSCPKAHEDGGRSAGAVVRTWRHR